MDAWVDAVADRRRVLVAIGLCLALLALVVGALALPAEIDDHGERPGTAGAPPFQTYEIETAVGADEAGSDGTYERQGELVGGTDRLRDRVADRDGDEQRVTERYRDVAASWEAVRLTTTEESVLEEWLDVLEDDVIVDTTRHDHEFAVLTAEAANGTVEERTGAFVQESGAARNLQYPAYERTGETTYEGREVTVHEPRDGWYEAATLGQPFAEYRVADSSGELYVDAESGTLLYADVSFTVVGAGTYADYVAARLRGEDVVDLEVAFAVREGGTAERPDWAEAPE